MKKVIILGQTNAGKTLFFLNFAKYLGFSTITITFRDKERGNHTKNFKIEEAVQFLVNNKPHFTKVLQSITLKLPLGKSYKKFDLIDTAGLIDGIHENEQIRKAMAQTLATVREADIIFHILDCAAIAENDLIKTIGDVDYQVAQFGQLRNSYAILANKIDLLGAKQGIRKLYEELPGNRVFPISALHTTGFSEVKNFVRNHL